MKFRLTPYVTLTALALTFLGCEKAAPPGPDDRTLFQVVQANADAINKKDVDAVMATIHPQAPTFASTRDLVSRTFANTTPKVSVSKMTVISSSPDEARVKFLLKTDKAPGDRMVLHDRIEEVHVLRPDNGKWKIYSTEFLDIPPPDATPSTPEATASSPVPTGTPNPGPKPGAPEATPGTSEQKSPPPAEKPGQ